MSLTQELGLDIPFTDTRHETVLNVVHTANQLLSVGADLFREAGLTHAQFNVLFALKHKARPVTQTELGQRLVVTRASMTSVLDRLEAKDMVVRRKVPGNRRIHHVELTEAGRRLLDRMEPRYFALVHEALELLSDSECRTLIELLERVRERTRTAGQGDRE